MINVLSPFFFFSLPLQYMDLVTTRALLRYAWLLDDAAGGWGTPVPRPPPPAQPQQPRGEEATSRGRGGGLSSGIFVSLPYIP